MKITIKDASGRGMRFARVTNVTESTLENQAVYSQLNELLAAHGVIVFDGMEIVEDLPFKIVNAFSTRKEHPAEPTSQSHQSQPTDLLPVTSQIKYTFGIKSRSSVGSPAPHINETAPGKQRTGSPRQVNGEGVVAFRDAISRHCDAVEIIQPAGKDSEQGAKPMRCARNLAQIERDMIAAEKAYAQAEERRQQAVRDRAVALVAINYYQAEIDGAVARLRERWSRYRAGDAIPAS